jgi:transcriptional regulator with XRE-family HTH domain
MAREEDRRESADRVALRFGENMKRCRLRSGLSQEQVGERAGLHRTEVGLLERGAREPRLATLVRLAGAMGVRPEELIEGIYWTPAQPKDGTFTFGTPPRRQDD